VEEQVIPEPHPVWEVISLLVAALAAVQVGMALTALLAVEVAQVVRRVVQVFPQSEMLAALEGELMASVRAAAAVVVLVRQAAQVLPMSAAPVVMEQPTLTRALA
jgi:hypothetical protein